MNFYCRRTEPDMLKNAIESLQTDWRASGNYYDDSRKRRHYLQYSYEKSISMIESRLRSLPPRRIRLWRTTGRFSSRRTLLCSAFFATGR